ncbi:hypothetical protein SCHPADRAFT_209213 [Schizopora paradoxa]|uniref:Uncharacterized protein n=1 Tax=Schizopora paradoxa TaxID=27342 RepID=A0A0H2S476_9AGAM|nr:hypothetical protein SCHPADRAFT_209213 [Schizopora paradoxa]
MYGELVSNITESPLSKWSCPFPLCALHFRCHFLRVYAHPNVLHRKPAAFYCRRCVAHKHVSRMARVCQISSAVTSLNDDCSPHQCSFLAHHFAIVSRSLHSLSVTLSSSSWAMMVCINSWRTTSAWPSSSQPAGRTFRLQWSSPRCRSSRAGAGPHIQQVVACGNKVVVDGTGGRSASRWHPSSVAVASFRRRDV